MSFTFDKTGFGPDFSNKLINHLKYLFELYPIHGGNLKWVGTFQRRNELYKNKMVDLAMAELYHLIKSGRVKNRPTLEQIEQKRKEFTAHYEKELLYTNGIYGRETCSTPNSRVIGCYSEHEQLGDLKGIAINQCWAANYEALTELMTQQADSGFHPQGTGAGISIVTHEYGHALYLAAKRKRINFPVLSSLWAQCNRNSKQHGDHAKFYWGAKISFQASFSIDEFFAECFAEYIHNPHCRQCAAMFGQEIDDIFKSLIDL